METIIPASIKIDNIEIGGNKPVVLIAGPCAIESEGHALDCAHRLKEICGRAGISLIYKSSYDKANRSSMDSFRGPGLREGLRILRKVKDETGLPVLSDIHKEEEVEEAAKVLDIIQVPAFLCRQTDLLIKVAETGKPVNIKKGQFLAPWDMKNIVQKIESRGNRRILLSERGVSFGYNQLVADFRSLVLMRRLGYPVIFDVTHSLQLPGGQGNASGGQREFIPQFARAGAAVGCDALFMEVHPDPEKAPCDGPNMLEMDRLSSILLEVMAIDKIVKGLPKETPGPR